jgi:hypothetical protein
MTAVDFLAYGQAKHAVAKEDGTITIPRYFGAGVLCGVIVSFIDCPVDLFKTQLQVR